MVSKANYMQIPHHTSLLSVTLCDTTTVNITHEILSRNLTAVHILFLGMTYTCSTMQHNALCLALPGTCVWDHPLGRRIIKQHPIVHIHTFHTCRSPLMRFSVAEWSRVRCLESANDIIQSFMWLKLVDKCPCVLPVIVRPPLANIPHNCRLHHLE